MSDRKRMTRSACRIRQERLSGKWTAPGEKAVGQMVFLTVLATALGALGVAAIANVMDLGRQ
ncbi:hypothetical protein [Fimbriiglobus ruber]|nr:hypothetical protein [Fimbriiglobus ruber]